MSMAKASHLTGIITGDSVWLSDDDLNTLAEALRRGALSKAREQKPDAGLEMRIESARLQLQQIALEIEGGTKSEIIDGLFRARLKGIAGMLRKTADKLAGDGRSGRAGGFAADSRARALWEEYQDERDVARAVLELEMAEQIRARDAGDFEKSARLNGKAEPGRQPKVPKPVTRGPRERWASRCEQLASTLREQAFAFEYMAGMVERDYANGRGRPQRIDYARLADRLRGVWNDTTGRDDRAFKSRNINSGERTSTELGEFVQAFLLARGLPWDLATFERHLYTKSKNQRKIKAAG
ncbi:MAG: hypothetical protein BWZ08_00996 [candidate division BRC1 bacterium ADurb.BinA292]|nr:MAG: hypothetical protein BWZ08_00996 [candidate division BRC1 bacterium ADurb.BinA292]